MNLLENFFPKTVTKLPSGEEILLQGCTAVPKVEESNGQNFAKVTIGVSNAKHPAGGYINLTEPIYEVIKQASNENRKITLVIEQRRKKEVDKNIPIKELTKDMGTARENTNKVVSAVYNYSTKEWLYNTSSFSKNPIQEMENLVESSVGASVDHFFDEPIVISESFYIQKYKIKYYSALSKVTNSDEDKKELATKLITLTDRLAGLYSEEAKVDRSNEVYQFMFETIINTFIVIPLDSKQHGVWLKEVYEYILSLLDWSKQ